MAAVSGNSKCPSDGPVGVALIVLSAITYIASLLLSAAISAYFSAMMPGSQPPAMQFGSATMGQSFAMSPPEPTGLNLVTVLAFLIPAILCGLALAVGIGVAQSKRWGFSFGIALFLVIAAFSGAGAMFGLSIVAYCVLRLAGILGSTQARMDAWDKDQLPGDQP